MGNFKRGGNLKVNLGVGQTEIVKQWFEDNNLVSATYDVDYEGNDIIIRIEGDLFLEKPPTFESNVKIKVSGYVRFLTLPPPA